MLVEKTRAMFEEFDELFNDYLRMVGIDSIGSMGDEEALIFKRTLKLYQSSKDYAIEMATEIDGLKRIESKLDLLIASQGTKA